MVHLTRPAYWGVLDLTKESLDGSGLRDQEIQNLSQDFSNYKMIYLQEMTTEKELKMYTAMPLFVGVFESDNIRTKWRSLPKSNRGEIQAIATNKTCNENVNPFVRARIGRRVNMKGTLTRTANKFKVIYGGSRGLGKELAKLLASKGAHVTIVAREYDDLKIALEEIKGVAKYRNDYESLVFNVVSADLTKYEESVRALNEASAKHDGKVPDFIFCCAEQPISDFTFGMQLNYFGSLYTAHEAVKKMVQQSVKGKIIFVSSCAGLMGFVGFSQYSPSKHALRGLADCLRNELILYDIGVHCYFPGTIDSPGLVEENKIKPKVTKEIEGDDSPISPSQAAKALYKGLCRGEFFITSDFITNIFRTSMRGISPGNNFILDFLTSGLGW
ncbi:12441_t:CDS:10, partial [Entrophospora sp. SA101]